MKIAAFGVALLVVLVAAMSCAGPGNHMRVQIDKKNEISSRLAEIREWRREAGMSLDPHPQIVNQYLREPRKQAKAVCPSGHAVNDSCSDVCTLAEHICDNAESICILADELGKDDTWAQEKCASAKASCREAKQRCCQKCSVSKAAW